MVDTGEVVDDTLRLGGLRIAGNVDAGEWILAGTDGWGVVASLVPEAFEAYARVFHPAYRLVENPKDAQPRVPTSGRLIAGTTRAVIVYHQEVRWAEVAKANGRVAHPAMEWASITGDHSFRWGGEQPGLWDYAPAMGTLPLRHVERLCELLAGYTRTPERCWFAVWHGYGDLPGLRDLDVPRLRMKHRDMVVLTGPVAALPSTSFQDLWYQLGSDNPANWYRSPSLWWPEDRAWCVASDVDLQSTYLGASDMCIQSLIDDAQLEILPVDRYQSVARDADTINPEPEGEYQG